MKKLLVTGWIPDECAMPYRSRIDMTVPDKAKWANTKDEVTGMIGGYEALYTVSGFTCDREAIDAAHKLEVIAVNGVGYNNVDVEYATSKKIFVVNAPISVCEPTAEFTIGLIMATTRGIARFDRDLRKSRFCNVKGFFDGNMFLYGKTLGIVGFGRIGKAVARKAQGLGMEVIYYDPLRQLPETEKMLGVRYSAFDDLVSAADVVTCHMPYTSENRHIMNMSVFRKMKKSAYFINAARGGVMCESDLARALKEGIIKGAGIDVFEFEPEVSAELAECENAVLTPHVATNIYEVRKNMVSEVMSGIEGIFEGRRPPNIVNQELFN